MIPRRQAMLALGALAAGACGSGEAVPAARRPGRLRVVFKHQPLGGDPEPLEKLLARFEHDNPDVQVTAELLPNAPGAVHQYFVTALEGDARNFDVFVIDVIWVAEFARAGWIADLSAAFPPVRVRREFLPGPAEAVLVQGGTFGVPWYADVGVLFRRTDLVPSAPKTFDDLVASAGAVAARGDVHGYVFQGLQSESLVCDVYEAIWGFGGATMSEGRVLLDTPEANAALDYLRGLVASGISPPSATSMAEEEARRVFQAGDAALMRNWPYAWTEAQRKGSRVRQRVAISALPTSSGSAGYGALGGFHIALNARTPAWKVDAAVRLVEHLTSPWANAVLALSYGRLPARRDVYADDLIQSGAPMIADLLPTIERARPRPVTPYYPMIADTLAAEFSAAITGVRKPAECLRRAQTLVDHLMEEVR